MTKTRQENGVSDRITLVYAKIETELSELFDQVLSMMKNRQDNDMTDRIGAIYAENNNELL